MWIRPGSDVVFTSRRRAASVPAEVRGSRYDVGGGVGAHQAKVIANYAHEDGDAIASASKRNDREFLYGVSAKMANLANNSHLQPMIHAHSSSRDVSPSVRRRPPLPIVGSSSSSYLRHAGSALTPDDNYEIAAYLERSPTSRPLLTSSTVGGGGSYRRVVPGLRATSLPPTASRPSVPRWYPSSAYYGRPSATYGGSSVPVGLPPRTPTRDRMDAMTDSVVGVAHTALYGDIVIGIPYKKRYMFNAQREIDDLDTQSLPAIHHHSHVSTAPHFVNTRPGSLALPPGASDLTRPYSRASYAGSSAGGVGYSSYRPLAHRTGYQLSGGLHPATDVDDMISIKSYPGAYAGGRGRSSVAMAGRRPLTGHGGYHVDDLENDVDMDFDDSGAMSQLSSLKKDTKSMLSRYSLPPPTHNGPKYMTANELDNKYGQILTSMQSQNRLPPRTNYSTSAPALPPYPSTSKKAPMSDTRRKLRDLLCKSRKDPHYFDD